MYCERELSTRILTYSYVRNLTVHLYGLSKDLRRSIRSFKADDTPAHAPTPAGDVTRRNQSRAPAPTTPPAANKRLNFDPVKETKIGRVIGFRFTYFPRLPAEDRKISLSVRAYLYKLMDYLTDFNVSWID
ncbi:hypothetical protein EVAR_59089_1 [Eumeta japonica]|uniref:Uncharacterized protein n=1 Tax=Eumeta variegata TaxID=151549 RepID=A0A4C1Z034_EUMVA|nr:hypothetical protein EVAR_59089_1 [Eumeta japonica]